MTLQPISIIRRNRAALRGRGVNHAEMQMLEEIALLMRQNRVRVLRGSYLGKCLGVTRQWANALLRRLADLDLITRFKTGLIRLNLEKLGEISDRALQKVRRKASNWLKRLRKSSRGNTTIPNRETLDKKEEAPDYGTRLDSILALRSSYIPVHLRKAR